MFCLPKRISTEYTELISLYKYNLYTSLSKMRKVIYNIYSKKNIWFSGNKQFIKPLKYLRKKDFMIICWNPIIWQVTSFEIRQNDQAELGWILGYITHYLANLIKVLSPFSIKGLVSFTYQLFSGLTIRVIYSWWHDEIRLRKKHPAQGLGPSKMLMK